MSNPLSDVYAALKSAIRTSPDVMALADVASQGTAEDGTPRRLLADGERVRVALIPAPGGSCSNLSSSRSRLVENFALAPIAAWLSHEAAMALKWAVLATIWRNRTLGLACIEKIDVDAMSRRADLGAANVAPRDITWEFVILIRVSILLDRTDLPMG